MNLNLTISIYHIKYKWSCHPNQKAKIDTLAKKSRPDNMLLTRKTLKRKGQEIYCDDINQEKN